MQWLQGTTRCSLEQSTQYPYSPEITFRLQTERPETFGLYLRVPAWAGSKTSIAINSKRVTLPLKAGSFAVLHRQWKDGDRIEYTVDMPYGLESIDPQHPNTVALLRGPLTLFAIDSPDGKFTRSDLMGAEQHGSNYTVRQKQHPVFFRTYAEIQDEKYRLYQELAV